MLKNILLISQIIIAIILMVTILLQAKGVGLSSTFGGEGGFYRSRRGVEKILLYVTIILAFLFAAASLVNVIL